MNRIDRLLDDRKRVTDLITEMEHALSVAAAVQEAEAEGLTDWDVRGIRELDQASASGRERLRSMKAEVVGIDAQLAELGTRVRSNQ